MRKKQEGKKAQASPGKPTLELLQVQLHRYLLQAGARSKQARRVRMRIQLSACLY